MQKKVEKASKLRNWRMQFGNTSDKASMSSVHLFPLKLHSNQSPVGSLASSHR